MLEQENDVIYSEGIVVDFWDKVFCRLEKVSLFSLVKYIRSKSNKDIKHDFVDKWVMGNLVASVVISLLVVTTINNAFMLYLTFFYSALRVFEVIIYQINVMLFHPYRAKKKNKTYTIKSPTRMVVLLLHNYIEMIFWYSSMVVALLKLSGSYSILGWKYYIESSFYCLATFVFVN